MGTFITIVLLVYVFLDIILDIALLIALKRKGYTIKDLAFGLHTMLTTPRTAKREDEFMDEVYQEWDEDEY